MVGMQTVHLKQGASYKPRHTGGKAKQQRPHSIARLKPSRFWRGPMGTAIVNVLPTAPWPNRVPNPMSVRSVCLLGTALLFAAAMASAQTAQQVQPAVTAPAAAPSGLPPGLTQSGGTIMMEPIPDSDTPKASSSMPEMSTEHRQGPFHALSAADHDLYSHAFEAANRGDWTAARALADQGHDAAARKLVEWRFMTDKNGGATFAQIDAFLKANPDWPLRDVLFARAEQAMDPNTSPATVITWFGDRPPASAMGKVRLGEALVASGKTEAGRALIRDAWLDGSFDPDKELAIVQKDGGFLTPDIDRQRLNNLLWRDDMASARRELSRVTDQIQQIFEARMALRTNPAAGQKMAVRLPDPLRSDPNLQFDLARTIRRANDANQAEAIYLRVPTQELAQNHPDRLWAEMNIIVRQALRDGNYKNAYALVSDTGLKSGNEFSEAEFMAGWIALRFLKNPQAALPHFQKLQAGVSRPISLARAHYWEGRCYEASGDTANAWQQYHLAAKTPTTFYGQVALARIDATPTVHIRDSQAAAASHSAFEKEDLTHAMRVLADLGDVDLLRLFAMRSEELNPDAGHVKLLAQSLVDMGYREVAVRVAKEASYSGIEFFSYTHPVISVPTYKGPGSGPEQALVLGLIRQETEFNPDSVSSAGARGMMQVMPANARHLASLAGVPYRPNDLVGDPSYNMKLGMAEFGGNLTDWSGSLVLSIAAYDAGPTNVRKWLATNGDPRSPTTDPIDWVEQIPFTETRNYVERVLENTQIYRSRLAGRDVPLRILADLYAPNAPSMKVLDYVAPAIQQPTIPVPVPRPVTPSG
jgi:soluble lytic murein transglycosylase